MAFAISRGNAMADINITPLVDVMLVLLVIFMVTVPAINYSNSLDLPQGGPPVKEFSSKDTLRLHLSAAGIVELNGSPVSMADLDQQLAQAASLGISADGRVDALRQPRLKIAADADAEYALLAKVLAHASNARMMRIVFDDGAD